MEPRIILNRIKTPDGTILTSYNRHDYKQHLDKNGVTYMVDGGLEYLRRSGDGQETDLSIYSDAPFKVIRQNFHRLNIGKDGRSEPKWVVLADMEDEWLDNVVLWYEERGVKEGDNILIDLYRKEQTYRNGI